MKSLKKLLLIGFLSLLLTLTFTMAAENFEAGARIFVDFGESGTLFLFGVNGGVEVAPQFSIVGYATFGSYIVTIFDIGVDALYKIGGNIGEVNIKPYVGAGFSFLIASISGISFSVPAVNLIGGASFELNEKTNLFAELRYGLPLQSGSSGGFFISSGVNYRF